MRKAALVIAAVLLLLAAGTGAAAQPSKESLIQAWENIQKSDTETVVFEKLGDNRYKFKTNRFPFDGELRILNVIIDDRFSDSEFAAVTGTIEYDLVGISDEVEKKYERSYSLWKANNTLYFDSETKSWMPARDYQVKATARAREMMGAEGYIEGRPKQNYWWTALLSWLPFLLLIGFWALLFNRIGAKRNREYMERATLHMNRMENLLERIAQSVENNPKQEE
ncbi:MAG TPA: hypothetical protein VJT09_15130 [Pyrinomonadaceae bacterium]|nr:hypothetical protein [Pyrinomonadaceae bacterium]